MSWPEATAPGAPASWSESPGPPAAQGPSWPEPPRNDGPWPEPPRHSRPDTPGPAPWPDAPPQGGTSRSWPDTPPPNSTSPSWADTPPPNSTAPSRPEPARQDAGGRPETSRHNAGGRPETPRQDTGWPDVTRPERPDASRPDLSHPNLSHPNLSHPDLSHPNLTAPQDVPLSWPESPPQNGGRQSGRPEPPVPDPVPAWSQPPPQGHPPADRTVAYNQRSETLLNDRAIPSNPMDSARTGTPQTESQPPNPGAQPPPDGHGPRPGSNLNRDPSDPDRRFVTAGQISGSRTPPPERQQELWNTVFGDDNQAMNERDVLDEEQGKPIWIYALGGSVAVALVAALLWAFLAGPLSGEDPASSETASESTATAAPPSASKGPAKTSIGPLPKYPGKTSPVIGRVPDAQAGISVPRLGGTWRLDQRATVKATYGFDTRQYVPVTPEKSAQLLSGPLSPRLASFYKEDDLEPAIRQVVLAARKKFFPEGNTVRKIAEQPIKVGDSTGRLIAYALTSDTEKATIVTMAVNTGGSVPAIVYMSIPAESKQLLPDIRTVMNQIRLTAQS
ncbi:hypothetical protein [Nonomuraea jiangxiensis]|nr:hypothetical protein [Nonomuraea jiangxiensis]